MKQRDLRQLEDFRPLTPEDLPPPDPDMRESAALFAKFVLVYVGVFAVGALLIWLGPAIVQAIRAVL